MKITKIVKEFTVTTVTIIIQSENIITKIFISVYKSIEYFIIIVEIFMVNKFQN